MPKVVNVPDGTYGAWDPDNPGTMTLWWLHKGDMTAWPKGVRYAPFPPKPPTALHRGERGPWRTQWYSDVYWPWKYAVIDAIAADLDTARGLFAEHVAEQDRPITPVRINKREADRLRIEELHAAFLHDERGKSLDDVVATLKLPKTTAWRRIEAGRELLAQLQHVMDRVESRSPWLIAADLFDSSGTEGSK